MEGQCSWNHRRVYSNQIIQVFLVLQSLFRETNPITHISRCADTRKKTHPSYSSVHRCTDTDVLNSPYARHQPFLERRMVRSSISLVACNMEDMNGSLEQVRINA